MKVSLYIIGAFFVVVLIYFLVFNDRSLFKKEPENFPINKTEEEWKNELNGQEYWVLREKGTEPPFKNKYYNHFQDGIYVCQACSNPLFNSADKYKSGSGWPSFTKPISKSSVGYRTDNQFMMDRTEVYCNQCGSHLGHVFDDGPAPTDKRYCINSIALKFVSKDEGLPGISQ